MDVRISPRTLRGTVRALPSKSEAHRALILAALSSKRTVIRGVGASPESDGVALSDDILRTAEALCALGAGIDRGDVLTVTPCASCTDRASCADRAPCADRASCDEHITIDCGESGSTLRFMIPVCAALGGDFRFIRRGRLPKRPISVLTDQLAAHGLEFSEDGDDLLMRGKLSPGDFTLPGNESSQYITGLLLALPLIGDSVLRVTGELESRPYVDITLDLMRKFGADIPETRVSTPEGDESEFVISRTGYAPQGDITVGGDWSGAANMLCVGANARGLDRRSCQGDSAILDILGQMGAQVRETADGALSLDMSNGLSAINIDMRDVPDLVPLVAVMCTSACGTSVIRNIRRLRLKESDRVEATLALISALGGSASATENELFVTGSALHGGEVDSFADHRIAMAAAVASCFADGDVTVKGAQCVAKSYPGFWEDLRSLGADITEL